MRLLHVPAAYAPVRGGTELLCQKLSEGAAARGHDVRVLTTDVSGVEGYYRLGLPRVRTGSEMVNGVPVVREHYGGHLSPLGTALSRVPLPHRIRVRAAQPLLRLSERGLRRALRDHLRDFQPDVVLALPHLVVNVQCVLAVQESAPFPLVLAPLLHDDWSAGDVAAMRAGLRRASAVLALTRREAGVLRDRFAVPSERIFQISVGVDLPPPRPASPRSDDVLFLGRKVPEKGIGELVAAMRRVWAAHPSARLVLAGSRAPATRRIDELVRSLPRAEQERVVSIDDVPDAEKTRLLHTARCLVLPSKHESFGLVLVEAMAHQTPVVALDLPVFREIVAPGQEGILVKPDSPEAIAGAILRLLRDPALAESMGHAGRETVMDRYRWQQVIGRYLDACEYARAATPARPRAPAEG